MCLRKDLNPEPSCSRSRKEPQPFQRTETRSSLKQRNSSVKDLVKKLESAASGKSETNLKAAASFDKRKSISSSSLPLRSAAATTVVAPPHCGQIKIFMRNNYFLAILGTLSIQIIKEIQPFGCPLIPNLQFFAACGSSDVLSL